MARKPHLQSGSARAAAASPRWLRALAVAASAAAATPALAQVIEIAPDGTATTYAVPAVFTPQGMREIAAAPAPGPATGGAVRALLAQAAARERLSPALVTEVAWRESRLRPQAQSNRDAVGVMQLTAGAARDMGVNRFDIAENIQGGAAYLHRMLDRYGDLSLALAAYNAGPGAVDRYRAVPPFPETQAYVAAILQRLTLPRPGADRLPR